MIDLPPGGLGIAGTAIEPVAAKENILITAFKSNGAQGGEAESGHHLPGELRDHLQIAGRSLGHFLSTENHQFRGPSSKGDHQTGAQASLGDQA